MGCLMNCRTHLTTCRADRTVSDDEKRVALLQEIQAWREARDARVPGSPQYRKFQNKMKKAEWELQALGSSQASPGVVIQLLDPKK